MITDTVILLVLAALGASAALLGTALIFRRKRHAMQLLVTRVQAELLEDIFALGLPELDTTEPGKLLLAQIDEDILSLVYKALRDYSSPYELRDNALRFLHVVRASQPSDEKSLDAWAANALRSLLRRAVDQVKPDGDRRFTTEWILYNILEMKFIEGRRVREVAARLALSEEDVHQKQKLAVERVTRKITEIEIRARGAPYQ